MNKFLFCLSISFFSLSLYANDLFTVTYAYENHVCLKGYEIEYEENRPFTLQIGRQYLVHEVDPEILTGTSYRRVVEITDPSSGMTALFHTRIINESYQALIVEVTETTREVVPCWDSDDGPSVRLEVRNTWVLDDGMIWNFFYTYTVPEKRAELLTAVSEKVQFYPGDVVHIKNEMRYTKKPNLRAQFTIEIERNGTIINLHSMPYYVSAPLRAIPMEICETDQRLFEIQNMRDPSGYEIYKTISLSGLYSGYHGYFKMVEGDLTRADKGKFLEIQDVLEDNSLILKISSEERYILLQPILF